MFLHGNKKRGYAFAVNLVIQEVSRAIRKLSHCKRKGDKALIFLLNNVGEVMAQGMHLQTEAEYIVKKIVKNYENNKN